MLAPAEDHFEDNFVEPVATAAFAALGAAVGALVSYLGVRQRLRAEEQRAERSRGDEAERFIRRYRDPLMRAAFDLQSRLYNIAVLGFLDTHLANGSPSEQHYARESTLYVLAEYLGWVELLRQEVQFLDLGSQERSRRLRAHLDTVRHVLLGRRDDPTLRAFRGEQRAIGELMITHDPAGQRQCIGFATFVDKRAAGEFGAWFDSLSADVDRLAEDVEGHGGRLVDLQHALVDLVDFLDPDHERFVTRHRSRIALQGDGGNAGSQEVTG